MPVYVVGIDVGHGKGILKEIEDSSAVDDQGITVALPHIVDDTTRVVIDGVYFSKDRLQDS